MDYYHLRKNEASGSKPAVKPQLGLVTGKGDRRIMTRQSFDRYGLTRELVGAIFGPVLRKKRMPRHRRSTPINFQLLFAHAANSHEPPYHRRVSAKTVRLTRRDIDPKQLKYLFKKELRLSDVSTLRRVILPKRSAESYLPPLDYKDGIYVKMDDYDGIHMWRFKFRFWPNNNSRMYVLENTGEFVMLHGLHLGDSFVFYRDENDNYVVKGQKKLAPGEQEPVVVPMIINEMNTEGTSSGGAEGEPPSGSNSNSTISITSSNDPRTTPTSSNTINTPTSEPTSDVEPMGTPTSSNKRQKTTSIYEEMKMICNYEPLTEPYSYAPMVMDYDNQEELSFKLNSNESPYIYDSTSSFSFPENRHSTSTTIPLFHRLPHQLRLLTALTQSRVYLLSTSTTKVDEDDMTICR